MRLVFIGYLSHWRLYGIVPIVIIYTQIKLLWTCYPACYWVEFTDQKNLYYVWVEHEFAFKSAMTGAPL